MIISRLSKAPYGEATADAGGNANWFGALFVAFGLALCWGTWAWTGDPVNWPRFPDDAFYYFKIAENIVGGHGSTMDQINPTNGYQPLWMLLLLPFFFLTKSNPQLSIAVVQLIVILSIGLAIGLLASQLERRFNLATALIATAVLLYPSIMSLIATGLESSLTLLILVMVLRSMAKSDNALSNRTPRFKDAELGLWLGLLMLSRLDSVWFLFSVAGYVAATGLFTASESFGDWVIRIFRKGIAIFWPVLILVLPYLAWNDIAFGHAVPISGLLKNTFPEAGLHLQWLTGMRAIIALLGLAVAVSVFGLMRHPHDNFLIALTVLTGGALLHLVDTLLFMKWAVFSWHFVCYVIPGVMAVAYTIYPSLNRISPTARNAIAGVAVASFALTLTSYYLHPDASFREAVIQGGKWANQNLPENAVLGMKDSGAFSYYSQRRVMNLDGLVNSLAYQDSLCHGKMVEFLDRSGVEYIVQHAVPVDSIRAGYGVFRQEYPCHLKDGNSGELLLVENKEIFRGDPYYDGANHVQLVIWKR